MGGLIRLKTSLELRFANLVKGSNAAGDNRLLEKSNDNPSVVHSSALQLTDNLSDDFWTIRLVH
jgi:hypothetical protein